MKRTRFVMRLLGTAGLLALAALAPLRPATADKCATCPELLKACKEFCGSSVIFDCQNHNPCAGTCTCG